MAVPGLKKGYSSALISRYIFGYSYGSKMTSIFVLISMIGWSAILLELSGQAVYEIANYYNFPISYEIIILFIGLVILFSSLAGAEKINGLNKLNVPILIILLIWIGYIIFKEYNIIKLLDYTASNEMSSYRALDLVIGGTIAGVFVSSDLNRYAKNKKSLSRGVFIGTVPITLCLAAIGIIARLATGSWNPVNIINSLGMGLPALLLLILSTWTTIQVSLYSGSLAATNIFPNLSRTKANISLGTFMILISLYHLLSNFENWLLLLDNIFSPLIAISLYKINTSNFSREKIDWKAFTAIILALLLKHITASTVSSTLLTMTYTIIIYHILKKLDK